MSSSVSVSFEIIFFRLYDLTVLGLSVVDSSGASLGRVVDSAGTIELSEAEALNAFVTLKSDADLPNSSFYVKVASGCSKCTHSVA